MTKINHRFPIERLNFVDNKEIRLINTSKLESNRTFYAINIGVRADKKPTEEDCVLKAPLINISIREIINTS